MADLPCPTCGSNLAFLEQYQRYYCHRCLQYAPEGYGDHGAQTCPTCGGILSYVRQYGRMYCYKCNAYPPEPTAGPSAAETAPASAAPPATEPAPPSTPAPATTPVLVPAPAPTETVVVVPSVPTPAPEQDTSKERAPEELPPTPEPAKPAEAAIPATPEPAAEPKPAAPAPAPAAPSPEMRALAAQKPAAVRVKLFALKKSELVDLCTIYHLDASGSKQELQDRLLDHLHELEEAGPEAETPASEEPATGSAPPVAPILTQPAPAPQETTAPMVSEQTAAPAVVEQPKPEPAPVAAAAPAPVVVAPTPVVPETPRVVPKAEHPCPTCGRELTYISQYNRYYCYSCQRYAPAGARAKNACPTCGNTMRWIEQHRRWWCDSCQRYASADLPAPGAAAPAAAAEETAIATRPVHMHRHGSPAGGAGLVGFGIALYIVYAFFGFLGDQLGFVRPVAVTQPMLDALQFFAFLLLALGTIVGLYGVRGRD